MEMETKDEFTTREPEQAQVGSRGPRLVINEMVMRNFKSYASEQRVGPFHKEVEKDVKARTRGEMGAAKSLCTPFEQPELSEARVSKQHKLFS
ncbi:structural maintenance of chromosomes protein 4-like isoform X1 [Gossypium raimondii]|uniref:structural maintenance of chromosomes protein 4 isoform X1 n=1 Tax=Gossypium raimondii TaxID=29730 RepID=UPI00063ABE03|nr:structural maintenance of chromosomes protein 4 isoform X1 [Gossypium raimondii]XP_052486185.1 structural maintenance of chromosomes protein 4-like isoform X1 [Gossypium raimondii]